LWSIYLDFTAALICMEEVEPGEVAVLNASNRWTRSKKLKSIVSRLCPDGPAVHEQPRKTLVGHGFGPVWMGLRPTKNRSIRPQFPRGAWLRPCGRPSGRRGTLRQLVIPAILSPVSVRREAFRKLASGFPMVSGTGFGRAYMRQMVRDHKRDIAAFQHGSLMA
jgi:hypothetical protein